MDGGFNFAPKFRDTIYSVSFEAITPKYAIDYGNNKKIPKKTIDALGDSRDLFKLLNGGSTCFMGDHVESKDFLYLLLGDYDNSINVFYNKQTNNSIALSHKAEIDEYEYELYTILCSDGEYLYGAFNYADIDELSKLFPKLQKLAAEDDTNPILFRYKVKF